MARKSPAFSFYPDSWIGGTSVMTYEEKGIYIEVLAIMWLNGPLKLDQIQCAIAPKTTTSFKRKLKSILESKFTEIDGVFQNDRLEEERLTQQKRSQTARNNGKLGGRPKNPVVSETPRKNNPEEKLSVSVSDSVSITDTGSSIKSARPGSKSFREIWELGNIPERFQTVEIFALCNRWHGTRSVDGRKIPFDAMTIQGAVAEMARSRLERNDLHDCLECCANNGWKTFNVSAWRRMDNGKGSKDGTEPVKAW